MVQGWSDEDEQWGWRVEERRKEEDEGEEGGVRMSWKALSWPCLYTWEGQLDTGLLTFYLWCLAVMGATHLLCYTPILLLAYQTIKYATAIGTGRPRIPSNDDSTPLLPSDGTNSFGGKPSDRIFSTDGMERDGRTWEDGKEEDSI
jgi:hypothetical protein